MYHNGLYFKCNVNDLHNSSDLGWVNNKSNVGEILSIDFEDFINEYHEKIDSAPILLVAYNGTAYSYIESIECLKEYNLEDRNIRLIDALQLSCYGNLPGEGKWMIANKQDTTYVDYSDHIYEFCKPDSYFGTFKPFVIKNEPNLNSLIVKASAKYIKAISTWNTESELAIYNLPFPVQFLEYKEPQINSLIHIPRGTSLPNQSGNEIFISANGTYSLFLSDGPIASVGGALCDPMNFDLDFINKGPLFIEIDASGIIRIRNKEYVVSIFDLVHLPHIYQEEKPPSNNGRWKMIALLLSLILLPNTFHVIYLFKKDNAENAISKSREKNEAIAIRSNHKRKMTIIASISFISLIVVSVVIVFIYIPDLEDYFWDLILSAWGIQTLGAIAISNIQNKRRKYDSFIISTLTMKDVDLNEDFLLYLRGFKQDDYKVGGIQTNSFNEEKLFSESLKHIKSYAIGMTKELYAPTGASRVYFDDNEWKAGVTDLITNAKVIIINIHNSENCIFEIIECQKYVNKTIFIALDEKEYLIVKDKCTMKGINLPSIHFSSKEMCCIYHDSHYICDNYSSSAISNHIERLVSNN